MKIQRADSPTSSRNSFFLPIGDDRERPRSPELLYPPIANIAEVMNIKAFKEQITFYIFVSIQHRRDPIIHIETTEAHVYARLKEFLIARHLRPRLRGLLVKETFLRPRSFLAVSIYLRNRKISAVQSQFICEVFLRFELPWTHFELSQISISSELNEQKSHDKEKPGLISFCLSS